MRSEEASDSSDLWQNPTYQSIIRGFRKHGATRDLGACDQRPYDLALENNTPDVGVFILNQDRWTAIKEARNQRVGGQYIRRLIVQGEGIQVTDTSNVDMGSRLLGWCSRRQLHSDDRSRIHRRLRWIEIRGMYCPIPRSTRDQDQANSSKGQRRGL